MVHFHYECYMIIITNFILIQFSGEVLFNQAQPDFPPDFIFGTQDQEFLPNIEELKVTINNFIVTIVRM